MFPTQNDFAYHRLSRTTQDYLFGFSGTNRARTPAFSLTLALALISRLKCEPGQDGSTFDMVHRTVVVSQLSILNEMLRIDVDEIIGFMRKLYKFRQHQVDHKGWVNPIVSKESAIMDFFGISLFFSKDDLKLIEDNSMKITIDLSKLECLFVDLAMFKPAPAKPVA